MQHATYSSHSNEWTSHISANAGIDTALRTETTQHMLTRYYPWIVPSFQKTKFRAFLFPMRFLCRITGVQIKDTIESTQLNSLVFWADFVFIFPISRIRLTDRCIGLSKKS
jgi:hypothetical protein